ncbi:hypothetical protein U0070_004350 [Myodes glareolus]|uniref:SH3 domain-containing protein n=1 Tax=Myodes glareolus TaxID=447135 RepID=A0AAW0ISM5_MYOGA
MEMPWVRWADGGFGGTESNLMNDSLGSGDTGSISKNYPNNMSLSNQLGTPRHEAKWGGSSTGSSTSVGSTLAGEVLREPGDVLEIPGDEPGQKSCVVYLRCDREWATGIHIGPTSRQWPS